MTGYETELEVRAGCPCGERGACCSDPQPVDLPHDHWPSDREDADDDFCEDCYATECANCGRVCFCAL